MDKNEDTCMLEENFVQSYVKIGVTNYFFAFLFCSQYLRRNEFLINLVTFLLKVKQSRTKIVKIVKIYNFSNLITSIAPLPKDIIPKNL